MGMVTPGVVNGRRVTLLANNESSDRPDHENHALNWTESLRLSGLAAAAITVWLRRHNPFAPVYAVVAMLIGGFPIFRQVAESVRQRRMTTQLSLMVALPLALAIRHFFTVLIITLMVLGAEVPKRWFLGRARQGVVDFLGRLPRTAELVRDQQTLETPLSQIRPGDCILIRPNARIPVDGKVTNGSSCVDQSAVTGEPLPVEKSPGSTVSAGSINQADTLEVTVTKLGKDTIFAKIIEAVARSARSYTSIQYIADRIAGYLACLVLGAGVLILFATHNLVSALSAVIVAGSGGIVAGTAVAILGTLSRSANRGVVMKDALHIEKLSKTDTIVLDKAGTLTYGLPTVVDVITEGDQFLAELLHSAVLAESGSDHPLAKAIINYAGPFVGSLESADEWRYERGRGITAYAQGSVIHVGNAEYLKAQGIGFSKRPSSRGITEVLVARNRQYLGALLIDDQLRGEAKEAIRKMQSMKIQTVLLTGDSSAAAKRIARELNLDDAVGNLLPEEKAMHIMALQEFKRRVVAMVGDGINDAGALAQADVGMAVGSGAAVSQKSADVVLIGNNLVEVAHTLSLARRCRRIMLQNFYGTLAVDTLGIVLATLGFLTPLLAGGVRVACDLLLIMNSARLLPGLHKE